MLEKQECLECPKQKYKEFAIYCMKYKKWLKIERNWVYACEECIIEHGKEEKDERIKS